MWHEIMGQSVSPHNVNDLIVRTWFESKTLDNSLLLPRVT